ncbi:MAG: aldo/keto reductase [Tannerellaceae bacterium]|jgi:predicted aldo/keto reductase-like oxidoreductase|nr:aldo/keto reductase [Tannerellaceae bacterium]
MKRNNIGRRDFIRYSAAAGAGALLTRDAVANTSTTPADSNQKMPERTLGKTGISLPILSMGVDRPDSSNVLRAAYNAGIRHFDTANNYQRGRNEEALGAMFDGRPLDSRFISTKIMFPYPLRDNFEEDFDSKLEVSLNRLRIEQVDLLYLHDIRTVENVKDPRVAASLLKAREEGKTKFIGLSFHTGDPDVFRAAIDMGIFEVLLITYNFKMDRLEEYEALIEEAAQKGIGLIGMKTMAGGTVDAEGKKQINGDACLKWVWKNKHITTVIPGLTNFEHLDKCVAAALNPKINEEEERYLASLENEEMLFCRQCNQCKPQCPAGLPIPDIMRAYMYAFGYKQARISKDTLANVGLTADACAGCNEVCTVKCPSGFNVGKKIAALTPLLNTPDVFLT